MDSITEFLGCEPIEEGLSEPDKMQYYYYEGEKLKYEIYINLEDKYLTLGADFNFPFGGNSLFEVAVDFDRINIETEPKCYGEQKILVCRKDYPEFENFKTLMIMKWENRELSVWPNCMRSNN